MHLRLIIYIVIFAISSQLFGQNKDTIASRQSFMVIPYGAYQQETSWLFGLTGGNYFKSNDLSQISSIIGTVSYTLLDQFVFNISPKIYFAKKKWYLFSNLNFQNFADYYYGIGNKPTNIKQSYISRDFLLLLQPQYSISKELYVGALISIKNINVLTDSSFNVNKNDIFERFGASGWSPYRQFNAGIVATFDSRDNQFYPQCGVFAKALISASSTYLGSNFSTHEISLDFRKYIPLFNNNVLAFQALYTGIFSKNEIPFQLLPTLGGRDMFRGFRQGMYRNNVLMMVQTEYRIPIYKNLKASIFCTTGDVVNNNNYNIDKLKIAYGAGLRYKLNDARVHLRLDIAKNNYGEKLQFYITASEAF